MSGYDAIVLASFGGPEGPEEVMPFLERVTAGRGVPRERLEEVSHHYLALGGVSPINVQNRALLSALEAELTRRGVDTPLFLANRNSEPYFPAVLEQLHSAGHRRILALATSAYSSYSGCRQYREDLGMALESTGLADVLEVVKVRPYFDRAGFIAATTELLTAALRGLQTPGKSWSGVRVLFTTHSVPAAMASTSGPPAARVPESDLYSAQHLMVAGLAVAGACDSLRLTEPLDWRLVYQSRSGPPQVPWLEPDINQALRAAVAQGVQTAVVVPIGFTSDHIEVIWDLDHEARETCEEIGLDLLRVPTVGTHPRFVAGLCDLLEAHLAAGTDQSEGTPWWGFCGDECCPNLRAAKPVVAGVST